MQKPSYNTGAAWKSGILNPRWKGGVRTNEDGYRRLSAGANRGKYEHRVKMEIVLGKPIPPGFEVDHMDFNRQHNCVGVAGSDGKPLHFGNLLLIDGRLHSRIGRKPGRPRDAQV